MSCVYAAITFRLLFSSRFIADMLPASAPLSSTRFRPVGTENFFLASALSEVTSFAKLGCPHTKSSLASSRQAGRQYLGIMVTLLSEHTNSRQWSRPLRSIAVCSSWLALRPIPAPTAARCSPVHTQQGCHSWGFIPRSGDFRYCLGI